MIKLEFLPHFRTACLVGDLVPGHFCWNCALRAEYSTCLSFRNGTNSLLASVNPLTPPSDTPTRGSFSIYNMNSENSRLCIMFKVNTGNSTSLFTFQYWKLKFIAAYNYLQFQIEELVFVFYYKKENVTDVYFKIGF